MKLKIVVFDLFIWRSFNLCHISIVYIFKNIYSLKSLRIDPSSSDVRTSWPTILQVKPVAIGSTVAVPSFTVSEYNLCKSTNWRDCVHAATTVMQLLENGPQASMESSEVNKHRSLVTKFKFKLKSRVIGLEGQLSAELFDFLIE